MLYPYARRFPPRAPCAIDRWLGPGWLLLERHAVEISAPPAVALEALARLELREMPVVRALLTLRGTGARPETTLLEYFTTAPFVRLAEVRGTELVAGILLPPRERDGHRTIRCRPRSAAEFEETLARAPLAAIATFRAEPRERGATLWTETWVRTQGALAAAAFSTYWLGIGLFSAWIRRIFLREARARAESARVRKASAEDEEVEHEPEDPTVREQARVAEEQPLPEDREESRQPTPDVIPPRESRVVTGVGPTIPCVEPDMDATSTFRAALWFAGAVAIVAGLVHAGWHFFFRAYPEMGGLRESHWEVFSLFNFSVGLLLLFMGAVAIAAAASRASTLAQLRTLSAFLAATWTVRFLLELAYPVRIPLLVVTAPSALLRVLMGALIAVLVAPQLMLMMGAARRSAPP